MSDATTSASNAQDDHNEATNLGSSENFIHARKVRDAFLLYKRAECGRLLRASENLRKLNAGRKLPFLPDILDNYRQLMACLKQNDEVLRIIANAGLGMFSDEERAQLLATDATNRPISEVFESKTRSTLKQLVREWSADGASERRAAFDPIFEVLHDKFPDVSHRPDVKILVPGCGLGRLLWELIKDGFSACGVENSLFMLLTSFFILNCCEKEKSLTIHPWATDRCNQWSFESQLRAVTVPDECCQVAIPEDSQAPPHPRGEFGMMSGDFELLSRKLDNQYDVLITLFFVDTAHNVVDYVEAAKRVLKPGALWINFGPLTYHYADTEEPAIELPMDNVLQIVRHYGFTVEEERRMSSLYTGNQHSMLKHLYDCAFFVARLDGKEAGGGEEPK